jgi:hypothetical protein
MRKYGSIPTSFWPDDMGPLVKGNPLAISMIAYLMSSPHSNMIGVYRLPLEYVKYDTGFSESSIREALDLLKKSDFCLYDEIAQTIYIPEYASIQVAPALSPKDNRHSAVQREVNQIRHVEFKRLFMARYGKAFHLSRSDGEDWGEGSEGPWGGSKGASKPLGRGFDDKKTDKPVDNQGASKGLRSPCEGASESLGRGSEGKKARTPVDNQGASKGLRSPSVNVHAPVCVSVYALKKGVKRGLGREEEKTEAPRPLSKTEQFFQSWPQHMISRLRKTH